MLKFGHFEIYRFGSLYFKYAYHYKSILNFRRRRRPSPYAEIEV
jgi:hypothetical protein